MNQVEIVTIFNQIDFIASIRTDDRGYEINHRIYYTVCGRYIESEELLILTAGLEVNQKYPEEVYEKFPDIKTIHIEKLSDAARRCIRLADEKFAEVNAFFNPKVRQLEKNGSGGPYRTG